jgi:hypothetical protein
MARTAVAAGAAKVVSNRVSRRQTGRWSQEPEPEAYDSESYDSEPYDEDQPADEQPPADDMSMKIEQLRQLGELKTQGVLTDAEFEQQKALILGNPGTGPEHRGELSPPR